MEGYRERLFDRLWHSKLYVEKMGKVIVEVFKRTVARCHEVVAKAGIQVHLNLDVISSVLNAPIRDWHGDPNEAADARWWENILPKVLDEVHLAGPNPISHISSFESPLLIDSPPPIILPRDKQVDPPVLKNMGTTSTSTQPPSSSNAPPGWAMDARSDHSLDEAARELTDTELFKIYNQGSYNPIIMLSSFFFGKM